MFIVFEGPDGAGKSTQIRLFGDWLDRQGIRWTQTADPGSTPLGESIRNILLQRQDLEIGAHSEMLLFMAARAQMVEDLIRPALEQNLLVVCDRFWMSTAVYQGYAGGLSVDEIRQVAKIATGGLDPDLTLVFDLEIGEIRRRLGNARDRMESRSDEYFGRVVQGYRELAGTDSLACLVDASRSIDEIHQQVCEIARSKIK